MENGMKSGAVKNDEGGRKFLAEMQGAGSYLLIGFGRMVRCRDLNGQFYRGWDDTMLMCMGYERGGDWEWLDQSFEGAETLKWELDEKHGLLQINAS